MLFSLREVLWLKFYSGELPPDSLVSKEIITSIIIAILIVICWWGVRRLFFLIAQRANTARKTGIVFCICWSCAWLIGSLELSGYRSFNFMVLLLLLSLIGSLGYLAWVRKR